MIEGGEWRRMKGSRGVNVTICIICQFPRIDAMGGTWQNIVDTPRTCMRLLFILASGWRIFFATRSQGKQEFNEKLQMFSEYIFELMRLMCHYSEIFLAWGRNIFNKNNENVSSIPWPHLSLLSQ